MSDGLEYEMPWLVAAPGLDRMSYDELREVVAARGQLLNEARVQLAAQAEIVDMAKDLAQDWWESRLGDMVNLDGWRDEKFAELAGLFGYSNGQRPERGEA